MASISLPERWILERYLQMLHRILRAARANARHSYRAVVETLTNSIDAKVPSASEADELEIETYLRNMAKTAIATRFTCNDPFDHDGVPYKLIESDAAGGDLVLAPGCESAMSLLDDVNNVADVLMNWNRSFWCRPRTLYERIRAHEIEFESGLARFTGFLRPLDSVAPSSWACDV